MPLMLENARQSLDLEPGCHRFDVCTGPDGKNAVFLYELYSDAAAFESHKSMAHFLEFSAKTEQMVASKTVETFTLVSG